LGISTFLAGNAGVDRQFHPDHCIIVEKPKREPSPLTGMMGVAPRVMIRSNPGSAREQGPPHAVDGETVDQFVDPNQGGPHECVLSCLRLRNVWLIGTLRYETKGVLL
jgi:hypothetical protein